MDHRNDWRERACMALNDKRYDTACATLAHAIEGTLDDEPAASKHVARGFAAVLVGTPDFGLNDVHTDCSDALVNLLHYAAYMGCDAQSIIDSALRHFEAEQHGDDYIDPTA